MSCWCVQRVNVNQGLKKVPFSSPGQVDFLARLVSSCKAYLPWADPGILLVLGGGGEGGEVQTLSSVCKGCTLETSSTCGW